MRISLRPLIAATATAISFSAFSQDVRVTTNMPAESEAGKEFSVEITVDKGDVSGFAKLQQELPAGFTASSDNVAGSTFSFKEQKVKFLWMSLPADKTFKVSYKVKVDASVIGNQIFDGSFSYIKDNETQKATLRDIINIVAPGTSAAVAANNSGPKSKVVETTASSSNSSTASSAVQTVDNAANEAANAAEQDAKNAEAARKKAEAEAERLAAKAAREAERAAQTTASASSSASSSGLVYKVQVAAMNRKAEPSEIKSTFNLSDEVSWENHEGLNKYTVGNFGSYKAAKSYSNDLRDRNSVQGPFVTAYRNGTRITVQEALGQ